MQSQPPEPPSHRMRLFVIAAAGVTIAILALVTYVLHEAIHQVPVIDEDLL